MRNIALEIPLPALALARCGKRHDAADARVEPLRDALDHAALAGGIAAFEDHHDLLARRRHPVLKLDQLPLQAEQFFEIEAAAEGLPFPLLIIHQLVEPAVVELLFQLLVEGVQPVLAGIFFLDQILCVCRVRHVVSPSSGAGNGSRPAVSRVTPRTDRPS